MNREILTSQLTFHEGKRLAAYLCPTGYLTIGVGRNCEANNTKDEIGRDIEAVGDTVSDSECQLLLRNDIDTCYEGLLDTQPAFKPQSDQRQNVLVDMAFNLGLGGIADFVNMWAAIEREDYADAAVEMLDSKWATQVGNRATELADWMEHNLFYGAA